MNKEITWNIVNSLLAGALVLVGAFTDGNVNLDGLFAAFAAGAAFAILQFKKYWDKEEQEYLNHKLGAFI